MMTSAERSACDRWFEDALTHCPPCSMRVDGRPLAELIGSWKRTHSAATDADGVRRDTLTLTDPASGLECRLEFLRRPGSPAVEWVTVLTNRGSQRSPLLENLRSLDLSLVNPPQTPAHLVYSQGTRAKIDDFALHRREINFSNPIELESTGSRGHLPFMTLDLGERGITAALGWVGHWCAKATRTREGVNSFEMGLLKARLRLEPGEEIRLPRVLLLFWEKDWRRGGNLLRRHLVTHDLPRSDDGQVIPPPICCATWGGMKTKNHLSLIRTIQEQRLDFDVYWMDAGWYGPDHETEEFQSIQTEDWAYHRGNYRVNRMVHPDGLSPITGAVHRAGMKALLWFSPYSAMSDLPIVAAHPDWIIARWDSSKGIGHHRKPATVCHLDIGNPECRAFLLERMSALLTEHGVDWFRDDSSLPLPRGDAEPADRQGLAEIRVVHGFYAFWDELRRRHPGLMIDNCGGGATRIDLETIVRSQVLWRSDYNPDAAAMIGATVSTDDYPIGLQVGTHGLSHWAPHIGGGGPVRPGDTYSFRSSWCGGVPFCLFRGYGFDEAPTAPAADYPFDWHRRMIADYRRVRKYYLGDFYPLTDCSVSDKEWFACQLHREDLDEGVVVALRRSQSPFAVADFRLSGLDPDGRYAVEDLDGGPSQEVTGRFLQESGLPVAIAQRPGSAVRLYRRLP
jgi:alpha-galactosidase